LCDPSVFDRTCRWPYPGALTHAAPSSQPTGSICLMLRYHVTAM